MLMAKFYLIKKNKNFLATRTTNYTITKLYYLQIINVEMF